MRSRIIYAKEPIIIGDDEISIFLAGPTPRSRHVKSWRPDAVRLFNKFGYKGVLFIPESRSESSHGTYYDQIEWEEEGLNACDCIMFWIPRDMATMPGLTTNDEFGTWKYSGKVVLGAPAWAEKIRYQRYYADKLGIPQSDTLRGTVSNAIEMAETIYEVSRSKEIIE